MEQPHKHYPAIQPLEAYTILLLYLHYKLVARAEHCGINKVQLK